MFTEDEVYTALAGCGFRRNGNWGYGTWRGYAITLRRFGGAAYYAYVAVRLGAVPSGLRKKLRQELKQRWNTAGIKIGGVEMIAPNTITFSFSFSGEQSIPECFAARMEAITGTLWAQGIAPANTCAISGEPMPDSLCFVSLPTCFGLQPVRAAAVQQQSVSVQSRVEENESNGNYLTGIIGAILGMLVGVAVNLAILLLVHRIFAILFALIPFASMTGYRLFKGKMSKAALWIVVALSLLAVLLLPYFEITYVLVSDYHVRLGRALGAAAQSLFRPDVFSDIWGELLMYLLFTGLGLLISWRSISSKINAFSLGKAQTQLETLMPNPLYRQPPMQPTQSTTLS